MRILLIAPASSHWRGVGKHRIFNGKTFRFSLLSLLSVAAATPRDEDITLIDEQVDDIPWEGDFDLVGITCMTALAPRAYEIADRFRSRGIPVVLGGMHPTFMAMEALGHADGVVVGEAEGVWSRVLSDVRMGRMEGIYRAKAPASLDGLPAPRRELLNGKSYATLHAVQATRGCIHGCEFCAVSAFSGKRQRRRPVADVIEEIRSLPGKFVLFVDDNLTADRDYARQLFQEMIPLKKWWMTQSTLAVAEDTELVELAAKSGCIGLFIGIETFSKRNLEAVGKSINRVERYREAIARLHDHGIGVEAGIVFGFDSDGPEVFEQTLDLLDKIQVDLIQTSILTPLPGTRAFEKMSDWILDWDWSHYDFHHAVFEPKGMSPEQLQAGHDWVTHEFYRPSRIAKRMARRLRWPRGIATLPYALAMNLAYYGRVLRWRFKGYNPAPSKCEQPRTRGLGKMAPQPLMPATVAVEEDRRSGWRQAG
ncbi:MAG: B12-binding domain-containing radical SAM protein [Candidatus Omnitrophica bacterium]|nr:B12-binding domain-containing radical SAM protein [Candidatus Omnitrophota bacterium]